MLESIARGADLPRLLDEIVLLIERQAPGMLCSILLLADGKYLRLGAAPSLPREYNRAIDGIEIGPAAGSCGTAAFTGQRVIVADIATHPLWTLHRDVPLSHGLQACWSTPILGPSGEVLGTFAMYYREPRGPGPHEFEWVNVATDLASIAILRHRTEHELRRSEAHARELAQLHELIHSTVADAIFYLRVEEGTRYRFASVNRAFADLFGAPASEYVGKVLNERLPASIREPVLERYRTASESRTPVTWEMVIPSRAGTKHVEMTVAPIFDSTGACTSFVGSIHDITLRVQAEAERTRLVTQLNQAHRMQALGTLAGGIAHDFNNILAAISGNAGLALQESSLDDTTRTHLSEIKKASHRAIELVRQILTFSRHAPPKRELVDAIEVTREAMAMLRATLSPSVAIEVNFSAATPRFAGDSTQFHQIVMNLVTNAAHALPARGGSVRVQLDGVHLAEGRTAMALPAGDYLRLTVSDNGCGMDAATLKRAFDPFFTTRQPGEGTGLGLSVVHGVVQNHRGDIEIRSRVNEGTTVTVLLPAAAVDHEVAPVPEAKARGDGEHVMYVDDEEALVFLVERALRRMGYDVSGFSDPAAALSAFRAQPEAFDVLVTDLSMPGMSGQEVAIEARRIRADVPVIMTSGYIRPEDLETAERLRINQLVYKANTIDELGQALAREIQALPKRRDANGRPS